MRKTLLALLALIPSLAWAADPVPQPLPYVFQPNTTAASAQVNADLNYIVNNINNWAASGVGVGTITGVTAGTGLSGGGTSGSVTLSLANTAVTPASYSCATITVDQQGRLTAASSTTCGGGNGTVTSVTTSGAVTSSPATITSTGTISLAKIISGDLLANASNTTTAPIATTLTSLFDTAYTSTQGNILYRGASAWLGLPPGTSGQFLKTLGASANPAWASAGTVTSITAGTGISTTPSTITGTGVIGLSVPVTVANGGTNATAAGATAANNIGALAQANNLSDVSSASTARSNILAAASGANSDITSLSGLTTPLSVPQGGTGGITFTAHAPIIGEGTSAHTSTAVGTSGQALLSGGSSADPAYGTLAVAAGGTGLTSGTSGGIPYFSSSSAISSSAALTANLPVIGGGAGATPTVGTRSGNTTSFATTSGSLTSGHCTQIDASGNFTDSGAGCGGGSGTVTSVATGTGLTGGTITTTGTISLATVTTGTVLANTSGITAAPTPNSVSAILDTINNTQGDLLYRDSAAWLALAPGNSGQILQTRGASANPIWTNKAANSTRQVLLSGTSATYTTPANCTQIRVSMIGAGAGGGGSGIGGGNAGSVGGATTFNSINANGGSPDGSGAGGAGGSGGTGTASVRLPGFNGNASIEQFASATTANGFGGNGGGYGGGFGGNGGNPGANAKANSGGGGGGGGITAQTFLILSGTALYGGGGAGENVEIIINSPSANYTYTVGAGGGGGTAGTTGQNGGSGGSGIIIVDEYYF